MKPVKNEDIPQQFAFCRDIWSLYKKFYVIEDRDEYWNALVEESTELDQKYPDDTCHKIILCVLDEFDKRHKAEKGR